VFEGFEEIGLLESNVLVRFHDFEGCDLGGVVLPGRVDSTEVAVAHFFQNFVFAIYLHIISYCGLVAAV